MGGCKETPFFEPWPANKTSLRKPVFHDSVTFSWCPVKMPNLFLVKLLKFQ